MLTTALAALGLASLASVAGASTPLAAPTTAIPAVAPAQPAYAVAARAGEQARLFTVGLRGHTVFRGALALSNGEFLLAGAADDFSWAKGVSPTRLALPAGSFPGNGGGATPFLLHVSADFETLKGLYTLPAGSLAEITRIRSSEAPGQPTGAVVISGRFAGLVGPDDAYWIARLDGNAVDKPIRKLEWLHVVKAPGDGPSKNKPAQPGDYAKRQPWDVRSDGQVVYAEGEPFATTWAALRVLSADGKPGVMPGWADEGAGPLLALKAGRNNSLRSATAQDFEFRQPDENGNPGRKGRYPDDYYFSAHDSEQGPGYTGYRLGQNPTQRISQISVDRRDNALYFGTSTQTKLPGGLPDFEPAIVALDSQGRIKWWARGYLEVERKRGDGSGGDGINSPPDQYVDHVAVDYASDRLLVLARCHGNNSINFWRGDSVARNRGRPGFKVGFTGKESDIHISWLGKYGLQDGAIHNATYVAEMADGARGSVMQEGPLAGWPAPNVGWVTLTTTRVHDLAADAYGRALVLGFGRRPITTAGALVENVKPDEGVSHWTHFARAYDPDLGDLGYATILRGPWDRKTGASPRDTFDFDVMVPLRDGFLVVGSQRRGPEGGVSPLATRNGPPWGQKDVGVSQQVGVVAIIPVAAPLPPPKPLDFTPTDQPARRR